MAKPTPSHNKTAGRARNAGNSKTPDKKAAKPVAPVKRPVKTSPVKALPAKKPVKVLAKPAKAVSRAPTPVAKPVPVKKPVPEPIPAKKAVEKPPKPAPKPKPVKKAPVLVSEPVVEEPVRPEPVPEPVPEPTPGPVQPVTPELELVPEIPLPPEVPLLAPKRMAVKHANLEALQLSIEALLFSSGKAIEEAQLSSLTGADVKDVQAALQSLADAYASRGTALKLYSEGSAWKLLVKDEHVALVRRIVADTELSRACLETLAVIAYLQPDALQSKVVDMRGGNSYDHIAELERFGFVNKEKKGRSFALRLTEKFYDYFDVEGQESIRKVFKSVAPGRERQKKLGELKVVDNLPSTKKREEDEKGKKTLAGLEVVDEPEELVRSQDIEAPAKLEVTQEEKTAQSDFLSRLDAQISSLSQRNDELDKDDLFKMPEPEPQPGEQAADGSEQVAEGSDDAADATPDEEKTTDDDSGVVEESEPDDKPEEKPVKPAKKGKK